MFIFEVSIHLFLEQMKKFIFSSNFFGFSFKFSFFDQKISTVIASEFVDQLDGKSCKFFTNILLV